MNYCALESSFWLGWNPERGLRGLTAAMRGGGASIFTVTVPSTSALVPPLNAVFALAGSSKGSPKRKLTIAFTWSHRDGFALPTISGEVIAQRFGPFAGLHVKAHYAYEDGASGRLFHEAIGVRLGRKTFEAFLQALRLLLTAREMQEMAGEGAHP
jgi:hypothetical protein